MNIQVQLSGNPYGAASDDAGGRTAAEAATSPADGTGRRAYAEVAHERPAREARSRAPSEAAVNKSVVNKGAELPAGEAELPADRAAFALAVHARVNLVAAWERLVRSGDEKVSQRALEKLGEMGYEGRVADGGEAQRMEIDLTP